MHIYKQCIRPGCFRKYNPKDKGYQSEYCECAAQLILIEEEIVEVGEEIWKGLGIASDDTVVNEPELDGPKNSASGHTTVPIGHTSASTQVVNIQPKEIFTIDSRGYIHFLEGSSSEEINEDKVVIYKGGVIYKEVPLIYDEMIFGRNSISFEPDVDLSEIDLDKNTSRKHLMIYKCEGKYFARNLSMKNSVHVERFSVKPNESKELEDENLITLSRYLVMVFKKKKVGRNTM